MTAPPVAVPLRAASTARSADAVVLAVDARSHGPREVEAVLNGIVEALGGLAPPTFASTHVVDHAGIRHLGALVWEGPVRHLDLLALARGALPPGGATVCRTTRHGVPAVGGRTVSAVATAAGEAATGSRGRVVSFPGQDVVTGAVTVGDLVATTAVDAVVGLAGTVVGAVDVVDTAGWVRPRWNDGRLELLVERGAGGVLRPFEQRRQVACCASH